MASPGTHFEQAFPRKVDSADDIVCIQGVPRVKVAPTRACYEAPTFGIGTSIDLEKKLVYHIHSQCVYCPVF